jgi:hypothetical protein
MRVGFIALLLAACAPKPAESLDVLNARQQEAYEAPPVEPRAAAPKPVFDTENLVPDFHDLLRWPLTAMSHPTLEPRFGIAAVFADPGIDWIELCKRGVQNRSLGGRNRDELEYLRGWCSALQGDVDTACGKLTPLVSSTVLGISPAVRIDVANILVDSGHADKAEHWIKRHRIDDIELLDTLAATYVEVGNDRDAWTINRLVMDTDIKPSLETVCRRLAKHIVLSAEGERLAPAAELEKIVTSAKVPNPVCEELHHAVRCWMDPATGCSDYLIDQKLDVRYAYILWLQNRWPSVAASHATWLKVAEHARLAIPIAATEGALFSALEAALRAEPECSDRGLEAIRQAIVRSAGSTYLESIRALKERCEYGLEKSNSKK